MTDKYRFSRRETLAGAGAIAAAGAGALALPGTASALEVPLQGTMNPGHILSAQQPPMLSDLPYLDEAGNKYWTGDLRGQPTLIVLWASNCGVCISHELPMMVRLKQTAAAQNFRILPIALAYDTMPAMRRAMQRSIGDTSLGLYRMQDSRMFAELAPDVGLPRGTPSSAIVDANLRIRVVSLGRAFYDTADGQRAMAYVVRNG